MDLLKIGKAQVRNLFPAYFLLVMASGILSLASDLFDYKLISDFFFWSANIFYLILTVLYLIRLFLFFSKISRQLGNHSMGAGFLTVVAASAILGLCYAQLKELFLPSKILLVFGIGCWLIVLYGFLLKTTLSQKKADMRKISGNWLLTAVSTQSLAVLTAVLNPHFYFQQEMLFFSMSLWLLGLLFYLVFVTIIIYRINFFPVKAQKISPSFWLDAGAAAVGSIAGVAIIGTIKDLQIFLDLIPMIKVVNLLLWVAATWWLILLFFQEIWRHIKSGFEYTPGYWSLVFPIGIYCVASFKMSESLQVPFLSGLAEVLLYLVWGLWLLVFVFMLASLVKIFSTEDG